MKGNKVLKIACVLLCIHTLLPAQQGLNYELQEIKISDKLDPQKLSRSAATHFVARFAENFAAEILQYRAVSCRDVYCEFNAYKGVIAYMDFNRDLKSLVFKNPASDLHLAPLSVMRSDPYTADGEVLELTALYSSAGRSCEKAFLSGYVNHPWGEALHVKRSVELWSPLNPKMNPMYRYEVTRMFEDRQGEQWAEIRFESKEGVFPAKCRLMGKGSLLYNITRRTIRQIVLENYVDFYSSYIRTENFNGMMATRHRVEIKYEEQEGKIFPVSVLLDVEWRKPDTLSAEDFIYAPIGNSRRNPFKYQLKEREYLSYKRCKLLNKALEKKLKEIAVFGWRYVNIPNPYYSAPYHKAEWDQTVFPGIDMEQVKKDLHRNNGSLDEQSEKNALMGYDLYYKSNGDFTGRVTPEEYEKRKTFSKQYYRLTKRELIPLIWGNASHFWETN